MRWIKAFIILLVLGSMGYWILNEPLPQGETGPQADSLARRMLKAIGADAFNDLKAIQWTYSRFDHHYIWNKQDNEVVVSWGENKVFLQLEDLSGMVIQSGDTLSGESADDLRQKAWKYYANDSFWVFAPFKVFDPGTERRLIQSESGPSLLVTYTSGGVTPGDSYLWILDEDYKPRTWKLWVSIIPIGGLEFTWENWVDLSGAAIATTHQGLLDVQIENLELP